jgi:hypothetical protein
MKLNAKAFTIPKQCGVIIDTSQYSSNKKYIKIPSLFYYKSKVIYYCSLYFFPFLNFFFHGVFVYATLSTPFATLVAPPLGEADNTLTSHFIDKG